MPSLPSAALSSRVLAPLVLACTLLGVVGCVDKVEPVRFADRDYEAFAREVYPVLLRDCGFPACHGAPERFFRVVGPGRTRVPNVDSPVPEPLDTRTQAELDLTIDFALSMIDERNPARSLLLRKPLAVEAGGAGHLGVDNYGRDVYRTTQDNGYVVLARWVLTPPAPETTP